MKKCLLLLAVVLIAFSFVNADVYIKSKSHTDPVSIMGQNQPAKDVISEQWMGDKKFAQISEDQATIIDLTKNVMFVVYHKKKQYVETTLPLNMDKILPQQALAMMKMMKIKVSVTPTGEAKKIGKWNCKGYDIVMDFGMGKMNMKSWATTDVPFDYKAFQKEMFPSIIKMGGGMPIDDKAVSEFMKVDGYQVSMDMSMKIMGATIKSNSQVLEITKKAAPAGVYAPPAGYKKIEKLIQKRGM